MAPPQPFKFHQGVKKFDITILNSAMLEWAEQVHQCLALIFSEKNAVEFKNLRSGNTYVRPGCTRLFELYSLPVDFQKANPSTLIAFCHQSGLHSLNRHELLLSRSLSFSISKVIYRKKLRKYVPCSCRAIFAARSLALMAPNIISISSRERPFVSGIILPNYKCHAHDKQSGWKYSENGAIAPTFSAANIKNIL